MKILKILGKIILILLLILAALTAGVLAFLYGSPSVGRLPDKKAQRDYAKRSKQFSDGQFRNPIPTDTLTGEGYPSSERRIPRTLLPAVTPSFLTQAEDDSLTFTWLGHSSFLLQMGKTNILVDPVLSSRCSPVGFAGPKRFSDLPLSAEELPDIDVLFISHDHYDHLDRRTIRTIKDRVGVFVVPLGVDAILRGWGVEPEKIRSLAWWESTEAGGLTFTLTPSQHFSGRNPLRRNSTLWGGVYIGGCRSVYYTGDGGYSVVFSEVRERLGAPELMVAECGQYDPAWAKMHMFPEETVQAGLDAGAGRLIPVHWGAFSICRHAWDDPIRRAVAAADDAGLSIVTSRIGQTADLTQPSACRDAWWEGID